MKKLCVVFAGVMAAISFILLYGCAAAGPRCVSERRSGYFEGGDIVAVSGVRETPFETDGEVGTLKPYTLITYTPTGTEYEDGKLFTYEATVTDGEAERKFGGALIAHPFLASYSAEFDFEATAEFTVAIKPAGGDARSVKLRSLVTPGMLTYDKAIATAETVIATDGAHETRARLIKNPIGDGVCWYIAVYFADGTRQGALIDALSAEVLAVK